MKVVEFKTISPFFEQERDGIKPFTIRQWDDDDKRFVNLSSYEAVKITNPATGESFTRMLGLWDALEAEGWIIIYLGDRVD